MDSEPKKVALVHDWLAVYTGSERVFEQILSLYPEADLFSLVEFLPDNQRAFLQGKPVQTSFLQKLPFARAHFRGYLPLMPLAIEQFDLNGYDLVISSSHAVAKGVITNPNQLHLSYIHSPIRYAWDMQFEYLRDSRLQHGPKSWLVRAMLHYIRLWDARTINGVDAIAANSTFIARRIWKVYRRAARVIYPPVDVGKFAFTPQKEDYYLAVARMVPYKKIGLIVEAFAGMPDKRLVVIGEGPERARIARMAAGNITFLGYQPNETIVKIMQRARAFVFAAQEDFGITPLEAQACGTPVIAFGGGGVTETVRGLEHPEPTGVFFAEQTAGSLRAAVAQFEALAEKIKPEACSANAARFAPEYFCAAFSAFVAEHWANFQQQMQAGEDRSS